jgi:hypothetical protein
MFSIETIQIGFLISFALGLGSVFLFLLRVRPEMKKDKMATTWFGVFYPPLLFIDLGRVALLRKRAGQEVPKSIKTTTYVLIGSLSTMILSIALALIPPLTPEAKEKERRRTMEKIEQYEQRMNQSSKLQ